MEIRQWPFRALPYFWDIAVTDMCVGSVDVCIHTVISLEGWSFEVWRKSNIGTDQAIRAILQEKNLIREERKYKERPGTTFILQQKHGLSVELEVVANYTIQIINLIVDNFYSISQAGEAPQ